METNITAWVNAMDVLNDWLLEALYSQDTSLGVYGGIGSIMTSKRLGQKYPHIQALVTSIHQKRYTSALSHAREKRTGRPTQIVKFAYIKTVKPLVQAAIVELSSRWG